MKLFKVNNCIINLIDIVLCDRQKLIDFQISEQLRFRKLEEEKELKKLEDIRLQKLEEKTDKQKIKEYYINNGYSFFLGIVVDNTDYFKNGNCNCDKSRYSISFTNNNKLSKLDELLFINIVSKYLYNEYTFKYLLLSYT